MLGPHLPTATTEGVLPQPAVAPISVLRRIAPLLFSTLLVIMTLGVPATPVAAAEAPDRDEQLRFMWAMAGQESGWDYYARNRASGAFGKYQIMPFNWPEWAEKYLGERDADQTPWNQEQVAFGKLRDLYSWLGSWKRVAYWWLTGSSEPDQTRWSSYAAGYVTNILALRKQAPADVDRMPERTSSRAQRGDWRQAARDQRLRLSPNGTRWPMRGRIRDGEIMKVRASRLTPAGERWVAVVTIDGRLGWLRQSRTLPTEAPARPARWRDVTDRGRPADRTGVRPRPQ